ncbi:DUF1566 domain-containing protein [Shewanella oncorhynchi]|uniref:Lcl C-terminal domain-containing protein n=1 Tax=Shewanella oncorhynchi TaxID=2726434 RepID=UPI003D7B36A1
MFLEVNKWSLGMAVLPLLLAVNAQANSLCAGVENSAIVATTPSSDFTDNGDGTVTHHKTRLIWQRCSLGQTWDGECTGHALYYRWTEALLQAELNTFAGVSDWRLPNKNELASIVEYRCFEPAINSKIFPNALGVMYWSSSPFAINDSNAWIVSFYNGLVNGHGGDKDSSYVYVRLVRDAQ